jgi:kumamolisin
MVSRNTRLIAFLAVVLAFIALPVSVSASQARYAGSFGSVIGAVNPGAEKYFTVNMRDAATLWDAAYVAAYFRKFGLQVSISPDSKILFAHGTYGQAGAAANTGFARVQLNGQQFTRTTRPETFPPAIASRILATTIYDGPRMHPHYIARPLSPFGILVAPGGGYTPANIATYYDYTPIYTAGFKGTGRSVAIISCGTALTADISKYESINGIPSNLPTIVKVDGGSVTQDLEPTLDVEREIGTANALKVFLYVVPSDCSLSHFADGIATVEADNVTKHFDSFNISYGATEDFYDAIGGGSLLTAQHADLVDLQAANCWPFVSSGDSGAFPPGGPQFLADGEVTVNYPASDDHVIAVGGTTASSKSPTLIARNKELGWGGSGGGVSGKFSLPTWQVGFPGLESTTHRNVPDVAFDSDFNTGYDIIFTDPILGQGHFIVGGTSAAAPTWAATLALVQQKRVALGKATLKVVGAKLYAAKGVSGNFFDITIGDNGFYANKVGYDAVTGLGVPDAFKLWTFLAVTTP